jgi:predicted secreted protein
MRNCLVFLAICLCVLFLSSCGGNDAANVTFTSDDLGTTQPLSVGQVATLALPANPSTGASWHRAWTPEGSLQLLDEHYTADAAGAVGGGGTQYFVLQAKQAGIVVVTVQYGQWWPGAEQQEPQTITFIVGG